MSGLSLPGAASAGGLVADGVSTSGLADNASQSASAEAVSLKVGQRIRVKWCLTEEDGENGVTKVRWWGATVTETSSTGYVIRYDAYGDFPEEEQKVMLISSDALQHQGQTDELEWRLERQVGEVSDTEVDDDGMDDVVDLSEMLEDNEELERELGTTVEQATLSHLRENMAADQQLRMLAGFRHFADHIKDSLREKLQATGEGSYTVTAEDVHAMLAGLRRQ